MTNRQKKTIRSGLNAGKKTDELCLQAMQSGELALWRRSIQLYVIWDNERYGIENQKWGQQFSNLMIKVMTCVAFASNLKFLRHTLQYALHLRVGQSSCPRPSKNDLDEDIDWLGDSLEFARELALVTQPGEEATIQDAVSRFHKRQLRGLRILHRKLLDELKRQVVPDENVKNGYHKKITPQGLSNRDLQNIIDAWDKRYIIRRDQRGAWKTIKEYVDGYQATNNSDKGKLREGEPERAAVVWSKRRDWILYTRALDISNRRRYGDPSDKTTAKNRQAGTPADNDLGETSDRAQGHDEEPNLSVNEYAEFGPGYNDKHLDYVVASPVLGIEVTSTPPGTAASIERDDLIQGEVPVTAPSDLDDINANIVPSWADLQKQIQDLLRGSL
ncbi:uncharacterized protein RCO7_06929 [Rhynchosporium graminicola]|uniref:Uncharacterized protein n=1 Tax=Rhynchosporium graminicola TaxID=2792576 RepID=A0A1E1KJ38_9HELO|nr:uncharacterized protein RCO7_06929 [Rhynchosporium commune]